MSGVVWAAMLITMIVYWATTGKPHYVTMDVDQTVPFISGKYRMNPFTKNIWLTTCRYRCRHITTMYAGFP